MSVSPLSLMCTRSSAQSLSLHTTSCISAGHTSQYSSADSGLSASHTGYLLAYLWQKWHKVQTRRLNASAASDAIRHPGRKHRRPGVQLCTLCLKPHTAVAARDLTAATGVVRLSRMHHTTDNVEENTSACRAERGQQRAVQQAHGNLWP